MKGNTRVRAHMLLQHQMRRNYCFAACVSRTDRQTGNQISRGTLCWLYVNVCVSCALRCANKTTFTFGLKLELACCITRAPPYYCIVTQPCPYCTSRSRARLTRMRFISFCSALFHSRRTCKLNRSQRPSLIAGGDITHRIAFYIR
jgi:hypothetical protein